jgi:hypothetical protein
MFGGGGPNIWVRQTQTMLSPNHIIVSYTHHTHPLPHRTHIICTHRTRSVRRVGGSGQRGGLLLRGALYALQQPAEGGLRVLPFVCVGAARRAGAAGQPAERAERGVRRPRVRQHAI